jgi:cytochrome c-type biogenesis protein CcmH
MIRTLRAIVAAAVVFFAYLPVAYAVTPDEMLKDPALEARARVVSQLLRCVVCQNQSIDDSSAPLAKDLRVLVRERLTSGDSNAQAIQFIVARYGNFVLLKPPMQFNTLLLWLGPFLLFALAGFGLFRTLKAAPRELEQAPADLSSDDEHRIAKLLNEQAAPKT